MCALVHCGEASYYVTLLGIGFERGKVGLDPFFAVVDFRGRNVDGEVVVVEGYRGEVSLIFPSPSAASAATHCPVPACYCKRRSQLTKSRAEENIGKILVGMKSTARAATRARRHIFVCGIALEQQKQQTSPIPSKLQVQSRPISLSRF